MHGIASNPVLPTGLLRSNTHKFATDMAPFFLHQYSQSHVGVIFEPYLRLVTEMALNLAYQVRKHNTTLGMHLALYAIFGLTLLFNLRSLF